MMSEPIIEIENLSKKFRIGTIESYSSIRDSLAGIFNRGKNPSTSREFWALKDIDLKIEKGETIGIIGRNGAGKSTLLKILSQITPPTTGKITMRGRVASLLEVGTGFHPELTGRENIFLNGAILGMTRKEIDRKFDEIVAFSEIDKFLDTPVKRYSSGMYVRLAFAVAAHLEPEILIVDEVLAVGDIQFQEKCLGKMQEVGKNEGRTVIFVSHNMAAIQSLCNKVVYLDSGSIISAGDTESQIEKYLKDGKNRKSISRKSISDTCSKLTIKHFSINPNPLYSSEKSSFTLELFSDEIIVLDAISIIFSSGLNTRVGIIDLRKKNGYRFNGKESVKVIGEIESLPFVEGDYPVSLYIRYRNGTEEHLPDLITISIKNKDSNTGIIPYPASARGIIELESKFEEK